MRILLLLIIFIGIGFSQDNSEAHLRAFIAQNRIDHVKIEKKLDMLTKKFDAVLFYDEGNPGLVGKVQLNTTFREETSGSMRNITLLFIAQFIALFGLRFYDHRKRRIGNGKL